LLGDFLCLTRQGFHFLRINQDVLKLGCLAAVMACAGLVAILSLAVKARKAKKN
jgi:hypothetical protein